MCGRGCRLRLSLTGFCFSFALLLLMSSTEVEATGLSTINSTVRALGMGDAYTALSDDSSALFYNPAGIVKVRGINIKFFSVRVGASGLEAYNKISGLNNSGNFSSTMQQLYGEQVWTGAGGDVAIFAPMFGFVVYDHADALIRIDNPVYPQINTDVINDYGYVAGMGFPLSPFMHVGANLRYVKRSGARLPYGASFIADLDPNAIVSQLTGWGRGYGLDLGVNFNLPTPILSATVSAVWKNVGEMKFKSDDPNTNVPSEKNNMTLGAAVRFDTPVLSVTPSLDIHDLNRTDLQLTRKINLGLEVGLPLVDIRGGFHDGYYTYGLGINMGPFKLDAASYGVELGDYPGQIEDRRYVVELTMEIGVGWFGVSGGSGSSGDSASGSSSSSKSSNSIWGGRRLKQRR